MGNEYFTYAIKEKNKTENYVIPSNGINIPIFDNPLSAMKDFTCLASAKKIELEVIVLDVTNLIKAGIIPKKA